MHGSGFFSRVLLSESLAIRMSKQGVCVAKLRIAFAFTSVRNRKLTLLGSLDCEMKFFREVGSLIMAAKNPRVAGSAINWFCIAGEKIVVM